MFTEKDIINPDERIVKVCETVKKRKVVFFAIHDKHLDYWRTENPFDDYAAWSRDICLRAKFDTRRLAEAEMSRIHQWRREQT